MKDDSKIKETVKTVIFLLVLAALFSWLNEKPKRWFIVLIVLLFGFGITKYEGYKEEQEDIRKQLEKCPTCPVIVGEYPNYECIKNCR